MADANVLDLPAASALTGAEHLYVEQGGADTAATADQIRTMALRGVLQQGRLSLSGGNLLYAPFNGNLITINGAAITIPDAGVTLTPTGLTASTDYNVYAFMTGSTLTLEAVTTAHATQTGTGIEIKSGDATRTLVGKARAVAGPAFADTLTQRFVRSWANRAPKQLANVYTANRTTTGQPASATELNTEIRVEFVCWADDLVSAMFNGSGVSAGADDFFVAAVFDAALTNSTYRVKGNGTTSVPVAQSTAITGLAEGYHYATVAAWTGGVNNVTLGNASSLQASIR